MKKTFLSIFLFLILASPTLAANTSGYAWSESVGWFDFSNVTISDTTITGYAYNDNTGWLSFENGTTVTNSDGTLSGHAWSESVGWFDFSNVTISDGVLMGYAYNDNTGWLSFEDGTTVTTTWAPAVAPTVTRRSSGSSVSSRIKNLEQNGNPEAAAELRAQFPNTPTTLPTTIEGLKALLASLQAQLAQLLGTPTTTPSQDLELNAEGPAVTSLQQLLISKGFSIPAGATGFFGPQTQQALIKFQQEHNITPAAGYYGAKTRAFINTLSN